MRKNISRQRPMSLLKLQDRSGPSSFCRSLTLIMHRGMSRLSPSGRGQDGAGQAPCPLSSVIITRPGNCLSHPEASADLLVITRHRRTPLHSAPACWKVTRRPSSGSPFRPRNVPYARRCAPWAWATARPPRSSPAATGCAPHAVLARAVFRPVLRYRSETLLPGLRVIAGDLVVEARARDSEDVDRLVRRRSP